MDSSWIPNPRNPITNAHVGARNRLDVLVLEGVEERVLSIDCKKHIFHLEPFNGSIASLPAREKEEIERVMPSGISKKVINFVLETLEDINRREAVELEALKKHKRKKVDVILKQKADEGGSNLGRTSKAKTGSRRPGEEVPASIEEMRLKKSEVVP